MTRMLPSLLGEARKLVGPKRKATVVFDRGGWSPKLFGEMLALGFDLLTYRKGRTRQIAEERFTKHQARLDGRKVEYLLHDQAVRFLRSEEHTSELQSRLHLVCRLLLEKKKNN